jgi:putative inorganic carbon (hco3(-)) transporter
MPVRAVWRPAWYVWALLGLAVLGFVHGAAPQLLHGAWLVITPLIVFAGVLAARKLSELPPAVLMCGAIVLTIFSGGWSMMGLGSLPVDRLAIIGVLLAVFLCVPGVARTPRLQLRNVHLLMLVTILYVVGSAAVAGTLTGEVGGLVLLDQLGVLPYLMFLLAPAVFAARRERNMLLATLVGLGAYLGLTAIFESLGPHSLVFPSYIAHVDEILPEGRAGGPFQSSVAEGFATFACAVASVIAFNQWHGQRKRYFAAVAGILCVFGCFLTLERGVWIAAVAGAMVSTLATRTGRRWVLPGISICVLVIGGALMVSPTLSSKVTGRIEYKPSVWSRQNQTSAALRMIETKPLLGFGWNRYTSDSGEYFRQSSEYPMVGYSTHENTEPLHDSYLSYIVELGLVGVLLWLGTFLWGVGSAIFTPGEEDLRPWKLGLLSIGVFFLVVSLFNPYLQAFPVLLLWTWAGVALGSPSLEAQALRARATARARGDIAYMQA